LSCDKEYYATVKEFSGFTSVYGWSIAIVIFIAESFIEVPPFMPKTIPGYIAEA